MPLPFLLSIQQETKTGKGDEGHYLMRSKREGGRERERTREIGVARIINRWQSVLNRPGFRNTLLALSWPDQRSQIEALTLKSRVRLQARLARAAPGTPKCARTYQNAHADRQYARARALTRAQVIRVFGKFPALRRIIAALTFCALPMLAAFSVLVIIISLCALEVT